MTAIIDAESILVIDVGSVTTRAILFEVADDRYRFIAMGTANTTAIAPFKNIGEGVRLALDDLQRVTGRVLIDSRQQLIIPAASDGTGVDRFAATISAGAPLKVAVVGLLEDVSGESARRLVQTTYSDLIYTFSLTDHRKADARLNMLVRSRPDLIVVAGGTDGGASKSLMALLESVGLACYLIPELERPDVFFVGNSELADQVSASLEGIAAVHVAANIRPTLDLERLEGAQAALAKIMGQLRVEKMSGVDDLKIWAGDEGFLPTAAAFGRVVRFLSSFLRDKKGVLGVDVGASATAIAAAIDGELALGVYPQYELGSPLRKWTDGWLFDEISNWLTVEITEDQLREYLFIKSKHPATIPVTPEEFAIEMAVVRTALQEALKKARPGFPAQLLSLSASGLLPFEPILATGSVFSRSPGPAHTALTLLDGLQPAGITTLVLDQNHIAPSIGAAAVFNPLLAVQVMDSSSFLNLGTVIAPVVNARPGQPVLKLNLVNDNGQETQAIVKQGSLEMLSLPYGQKARLSIQPFHRADIGMGAPGRGGSVTVKGGVLGVIIDARGRPLRLPKEIHKRQEAYKKWIWSLGGH